MGSPARFQSPIVPMSAKNSVRSRLGDIGIFLSFKSLNSRFCTIYPRNSYMAYRILYLMVSHKSRGAYTAYLVKASTVSDEGATESDIAH